MTKESVTYTLFGDLDGLTVRELKDLLDDYPDDAILDARTEWDYWTNDEREYFVLMTKED